MPTCLSRLRHRLLALLLCLIACAPSAGAETFIGANVDSRIMIGFKVAPAQVQARLPDGWTSIAFASGPLKGANLLMGLEERLFAMDAQGTPLPVPTSRTVALMALAQQTGGTEARLYVLRLFTSNPDDDPFKNAIHARVSRHSEINSGDNTIRSHAEEWHVALDNGNALNITTRFTTGRGLWLSETAHPYSNTDPTISRVFSYAELVEPVMSTPAGMPLSGDFKLSTSIPELHSLLDGSQELVAMMNIPTYVRTVFTP